MKMGGPCCFGEARLSPKRAHFLGLNSPAIYAKREGCYQSMHLTSLKIIWYAIYIWNLYKLSMLEITGFKINRPTATSGILLNFLEWRLSVLFWTIYLVIDIRLSKVTSYQFINRTGHLGNDGWRESHEDVFLVYCWRTIRHGIDGYCRNLCYGKIKD